MKRLIAAVILLAAATANAQPKVELSLKCMTAGREASPISEIAVGREFDLALFARDLRPEGSYLYAGEERDLVRGVYAAYCDIHWDKSKVTVRQATGTSNSRLRFFNAFVFKAPYRNGMQAFDDPDGITRLGAFQGLSFGGDTEPHEIVRGRMVAIGTGPVTFSTKLTGLRYPLDDTLVYGNLAANPPEQSFVKSEEMILGRTLLLVR